MKSQTANTYILIKINPANAGLFYGPGYGDIGWTCICTRTITVHHFDIWLFWGANIFSSWDHPCDAPFICKPLGNFLFHSLVQANKLRCSAIFSFSAARDKGAYIQHSLPAHLHPPNISTHYFRIENILLFHFHQVLVQNNKISLFTIFNPAHFLF